MGQKKPSNSVLARLSERWGLYNLVAAIVAIIVAIALGVYFGIRSERFQTQLATMSGSLDRAMPTLYVGGLKTDWQLTIAYGAPFPEKNDTFVFLPLQIKNEGKKTWKRVELFITEPVHESVDSQFLKSFLRSELPFPVDLNRHFTKDNQLAHVSYLLPDLNPDQAMQINELIVVEQPRTTNGRSAGNGVPILYKQVSYLFLPISVSISGEDLPTSSFKFEIVGVQTQSPDELDKFFDGLIKMRLQEQPAPSWWARITKKAAPVQGRGLRLMPIFDQYTMPDGYTEFIAKPDMPGSTTEYSFHLR